MTLNLLHAARRHVSRLRTRFRRRWDALRFPTRRRASWIRVRELGRPKRILIICHGNICRSPYLEAALRSRLSDIDIVSAGFVGPGRSVPTEGIQVAARRGLDLTSHRSRLVSEGLLSDVDLVIAMDPGQARSLRDRLGVDPRRIILAGDLHCSNGDLRGIPDPWRQPVGIFEQTYARLDECAAVLVDWMRRTPTTPALSREP